MSTSSQKQDSPLERVFEAADCRTQEELAGLLGIRQSAVSDAKRRKSVPAEWLVCLFRLRNVNPEWVLTGCGPKYLNKETGQTSAAYHLERKPRPSAEMLSLFSSKALADELVRRAGTPACHSKKQTA
ncbi:MAG: helix-turn-helix domain containing protein [Deltaproteobacteria bacterium]|nr:helix-turn-helix domain containing protein [Deltaproteobacteria bacterium]